MAASLGATKAVAYDLTAACSGFLFATITASQFLHTGTFKHAIVVGADALSRSVLHTTSLESTRRRDSGSGSAPSLENMRPRKIQNHVPHIVITHPVPIFLCVLLIRWVDWTDRNTCILFGDGAGAMVLTATDSAEDSGTFSCYIYVYRIRIASTSTWGTVAGLWVNRMPGLCCLI